MAPNGRKSADATLLRLLASGCTVAAAAQEVHISERTIFRRLHDPAFRQQVQEIRAHALEQATAKLATAADSAVTTLVALLVSESDAVRLGAARSILEVGTRLRENVEFADRLSVLEAAGGRL